MPSRALLRQVLLVSAIAGAIGLTVAATLLHGVLPPPLTGYGLTTTILLLCVPFGAALGSLTGLGVVYSWARRRRVGGAVCALGAAAVQAIAVLIVWLMATSKGIGLFKVIVSLAIWFGVTTLWSLLLFGSGLLMLLRRR